jgi:hypothetical protein
VLAVEEYQAQTNEGAIGHLVGSEALCSSNALAAILTTSGFAVYPARMGNAVSPRGDMLKHRVLTRSKRGTLHVVDKLNLN